MIRTTAVAVAVLSLSLSLAGSVALAQEPAAPPAPSDPPAAAVAPERVELAVEALDPKGQPVPRLAPGDLAVVEDGEPRRVVEVAPAAGSYRVVVWVDRVLAGPATVMAATNALADRAADLAALGEVEVIVAEPEPRSLLAPSRQPAAINDALSRAFFDADGRDDLRALRRRFLADGAPEGFAERAAEAADDEARLVARQGDRMAEWLARRGGQGPGVLFLVADGWDLEPRAFYLGRAPAAERAATEAALAGASLAPASRDLARIVAALGWTTVALPVGGAELPTAPRWGMGNIRGTPSARVTLGKRPEKEPPPPEVLLEPGAPLAALATETGGEVVASPLAVPAALARLAARSRVGFESRPAADGRIRDVAVTASRPEVALRARRLHATTTPPELAARRALRLAEGEEGVGLDVAAVVRRGADPERGLLEVRADLSPAADAPAGGVRITVIVADGAPGPATHVVLAGPPARSVAAAEEAEPAAGTAAGAEWSHAVEVPLPAGAERLAVVVEALGSGLWGGDLAAVVAADVAEEEEEEEDAAATPAASGAPAVPAVRLLVPDGRLSGKVRVRARTGGPAVARIAFLLDGRRVAACDREPCEASVDLGRAERPRTLEAVAYGADGREVGRDAMRVGSRTGGPFRVRIVSPAQPAGVGPVEVEADVRAPAGRRVERVEMFWNDELAATLYGPPFRHRVVVPRSRPVGYLRVAARLDDGTVTDDAMLLNVPTAGERVDVELVELLVVVTDRVGRPVRGLPRDRFRVVESGRAQEIASFENVGDVPLTLALAIDSSASMFRKLPTVQQAAESLLVKGLAERDRALLVDFDSEPRLVRAPTRDLQAVAAALDRLRADGGTDLWEGIDFTLGQLAGVEGRKALIVYADGVNEEEAFSYRALLRAARRSGAPIYLILARSSLDRLEGGLVGGSYADKLERLTAETGGRTYLAPPDRDLSGIYREILEELRSQYLVTYYPRELAGGVEWRDVKVEVAGEGLTARTFSGAEAQR